MSTYSEIDEEKLSLSDMPDELLKKVRRSVGLFGNSQKEDLYHGQGSEKRSRREIANCNERRRMQSINSGFESLKTLLPTEDGEKLSKAAILQLTSKYIQHLVGENRRMRDQLSQMQQQQPQQQQQQQQQQQPRQTDQLLAASDVALRKRKLPAAPDDGDGGGGGGVYIGYFQQQGNHAIIRAQQQHQQQQPQHPTFQLAVKPDYEQFVIEPAVQQQQQQQQQQQPLSAKPKRLEHLMMAIERIEGQSNQQQQQQQSVVADRPRSTEAATRCLLQQQQQQPAVMISPFTPHDTQQNDDGQCHSAAKSAAVVVGNDVDKDAAFVFVDNLDFSSAAEAETTVTATSETSTSPESPGLQCRPRSIPHKYLHRPQVVQANRSN